MDASSSYANSTGDGGGDEDGGGDGDGTGEALQWTPSEQESQPQPSKKAQKKAAKAAYRESIKHERRAREKEQRKRRKQERLEAEQDRRNHEPAVDDAHIASAPPAQLSVERRRKRRKVDPDEAFRARVVVDLGFDETMTDKVSAGQSSSGVSERRRGAVSPGTLIAPHHRKSCRSRLSCRMPTAQTDVQPDLSPISSSPRWQDALARGWTV